MQSSHPRKAALIVEYDGTSYHGFQYQPGVPTVQSEIESAIHRLTMEKARIKAAGRTDVGVHAKGQAVAFLTRSNLSPDSLLSGLNHFLPSDIAVKKAYYVDASFDPRRHAVSRVYRYSILNSGSPSPLRERYSARVAESLDEDAMRLALDWMIGEHDFAPLSGPVPPGKSTVRRILAGGVDRDEDTGRFQVEANAFLPHQMRRIAGLLVAVGNGRASPEAVPATLQGSTNPWSSGLARTMPPQGLCLLQVNYKDFLPNGY